MLACISGKYARGVGPLIYANTFSLLYIIKSQLWIGGEFADYGGKIRQVWGVTPVGRIERNKVGKVAGTKARLLRVIAATSLILAVVCLAVARPVRAGNVQLTPETAAAFARYVRLTDARNDAEPARGSGLLWIDSLPEKERAAAYLALRNGEVKLQKLDTLQDGAEIKCPDGMIHHWVGVAFIPGVSVDDVLTVLQDYDRQSVYYAPDVERSKLESRDGDRFRVFLRFRRKKVITVVLDTEHQVTYFRDAAGLARSRSSAVKISEVDNPGAHDEREMTPGDDDGFMWKMETWWRVVQKDGGVYVQSEVASLTRDIPAGLGWIAGPFVTAIPKESLTFTLEATRKGVLERKSQ
jgi:hypothetical protein